MKKRKKRENRHVQVNSNDVGRELVDSPIFMRWMVIYWILVKYSLKRQFHRVSKTKH